MARLCPSNYCFGSKLAVQIKPSHKSHPNRNHTPHRGSRRSHRKHRFYRALRRWISKLQLIEPINAVSDRCIGQMSSAGWSVLRRASKSIATSVAPTRAKDIGAVAPPVHAVVIARSGVHCGGGVRCPQARPMRCNARGAKCSCQLQCSVELLRRTASACSSAHIANMGRVAPAGTRPSVRGHGRVQTARRGIRASLGQRGSRHYFTSLLHITGSPQ